MKERRQYLVALVAIAAGAGLALLASVPTWITATITTAGLGTSTFTVSGSQAAVGLVAMSLVALAGTVAVLATGGRTRTFVGVFVALVGCGMVALATVPGVRPAEAARGPVVNQVGSVTGTLETDGTLWWVLAVVGGLLVISGGVATVRGGRSWATMSARYDRSSSPRRTDPWSALDRGEDPTEDVSDPGAPRQGTDLPE